MNTTPQSLHGGVRGPSYLTDENLVVVLVRVLAQSVCHVGDPVPQMVHSIFTANAKQTDAEKSNRPGYVHSTELMT